MNIATFQTPSARPNYESLSINNYRIRNVLNGFGIVADEAGVLFISLLSSSGNCTIFVNEIEIAQFYGTHRPIINIPVRVGDTVYFQGSSSSTSFSSEAFKIVLIPYA